MGLLSSSHAELQAVEIVHSEFGSEKPCLDSLILCGKRKSWTQIYLPLFIAQNFMAIIGPVVVIVPMRGLSGSAEARRFKVRCHVLCG